MTSRSQPSQPREAGAGIKSTRARICGNFERLFFAGVGATGRPAAPSCQLQIENRHPQNDANHADAGNYYRARLAYPEHVLQPGTSETYEVLAYIGPKGVRRWLVPAMPSTTCTT